MKRAILIILLSLFSLLSTAQSDSSADAVHVELGPILLGGASMFMGRAPEGSQTRPSPAFTTGVMISTYSAGSDLAILAALTYESRSIYFHTDGEPTFNNQKISINYLSTQIGAKWREFFLLCVAGFPVSAYQTYTPHSWIYTTENNPDPIVVFKTGPMTFRTEDMLLDLRIGGIVSLMEFNNDHLDLQMLASYSLSNVVKDGGFQVSPAWDPSERVMKSPVVSFQVGAIYFFSLR